MSHLTQTHTILGKYAEDNAVLQAQVAQLLEENARLKAKLNKGQGNGQEDSDNR